MDYNIVKKNLTKPKKIKIKKEKIDFTELALKMRASFVVPNNKAYSVSKEINDARLDDDMYAVFKMNTLLNTNSFYTRDYVYQCGAVSFAGEYFCRLFGFDGIFIKAEIKENPEDFIFPFEINEENAKVFIKNLQPQQIKYYDYTLSSSYFFSILKILGIFKQYELTANVLNLKSHLYIDEYLSLLNIMNTSLELFNKDCNKEYFLFNSKNSITFSCFAHICKSLITYYPIFCEKIEKENQETFILALMENLNIYCFDTSSNNYLSLEKLFNNDNNLIQQYKLHFGKRSNALTLIDNCYKFQNEKLKNDYDLYCSWINKCVKIYCEHYIKQSFEIMPQEYIQLLQKILSFNGYNLCPQLCKGFVHHYKKDIKLYNYFFNLYNNNVPHNKFKVKEELKKINKRIN